MMLYTLHKHYSINMYIAFWLVIMLHIIKNKEPEIYHFGVIYGGIEFAQMTNNFQIVATYVINV